MLSKRYQIAEMFAVVSASVLLVMAVKSSAARSKGAEVTFTRDVAPILFESCARCHRPGDIAPFSVLEYKDVRPWARSIREKVLTREMPPWHADPRYGDFRTAALLSPKAIETIVAWVDEGAKEGDPKLLPPVPDYNANSVRPHHRRCSDAPSRAASDDPCR